MPKTTSSVFSAALSLLALVGITLLAASFWPAFHPFIVVLGSLRLHMALVVLGLAIVLFLLGQKTAGYVFGLIAMMPLLYMVTVLAPHTVPFATASDGVPVKVMSFNIQGGNRENGERIVDFIETEKPDIVFIQEARPLFPFLERLEKTYPHRIGCGVYVNSCGSLVLSRFSLDKPDYYLSEVKLPARFFLTAARIENRKVALAIMHLAKPDKGSQQAIEFSHAAERIGRIATPVIVAGDFNAAPWSPHFIDFFHTSGLQRRILEPATWPTGLGLFGAFGFPIDHIFVRGAGFRSLSALEDNFGSNHRGLIAELVLFENE